MNYLERHPMIMIVVGILGISSSAILVKFSAAPSIVTAAFRLLWTVALMTPVALGNGRIRREIAAAGWRTLGLCAASGVCLALHFTAWFESLSQTSVASSTAIVCTEVIWVALGYRLFLGGRLRTGAVGAIAVTVAGSVLIAFSDYTGQGESLYGDGLALSAAIFAAVYTLIGRRLRQGMSTTAYTYVVYGFCALALCLGTACSGQSFGGHGPSAAVVGLLLAVFSTLLGHSVFSWCLKFMSPAYVSASKLCEPVAAAILAALVFGEIPVLLQVAGGLVTIGGVLRYSWIERREAEGKEGKESSGFQGGLGLKRFSKP